MNTDRTFYYQFFRPDYKMHESVSIISNVR